jgi:hypothetical protein
MFRLDPDGSRIGELDPLVLLVDRDCESAQHLVTENHGQRANRKVGFSATFHRGCHRSLGTGNVL